MMCTSRLHLVVEQPRALDDPVRATAVVEDLDGGRHQVALLALEGPPPEAGDWLIVHSGYAVGRASRAEAESARALLSGDEHETTELEVLVDE